MKEKIIKVYEYSELSKEAKKKVLNFFREINDFPFLSEQLEEYLKELLTNNKIEFDNSLKIGYSLSNCQEDGFNFIDNITYKKMLIRVFKNNSHYEHYNTVGNDIIDFNGVYYEELDDNQKEKADKLLIEFEAKYKDIFRKCEYYGYKIIETEQSEESIKDNIEANGYTFRENGDIENI